MKLSVETEDGTVYEAKCSNRTWQCAADRFRFERKFGVSTMALQAWQEAAPQEDENGEMTLTVSQVSDEALRLMREEHLLFFIVCELHRRVDGGLPPFDELAESVVDYEIDMSDEQEGGLPDPSSAVEIADG